MTTPFKFPARYMALLSQFDTNEPRAWLGDVGFRLPVSDRDRGRWAGVLTDRRWQGMHPDLMPFAEDGFGNQFCFYRRPREGAVRSLPIVYWMYETYRAVPIASSFDGFLAWIGLTGFVAARHGDPIVDRTHLTKVLWPALDAVGIHHDYGAALESHDPTGQEVQKGYLQLDPESPAALLSMAQWESARGRPLEALDYCAEAAFSFPDFAASRYTAARILNAAGDGVAEFDALMQTLERPMLFGGDAGMTGFRALPQVDVRWVVDELAKHPAFAESEATSPLWTLVLRDDPSVAQSWVDAALDYAEENELERSVTMATNALFLGFGSDLGPLIHGLLGELYSALGWDWHQDVVLRWAEDSAQ